VRVHSFIFIPSFPLGRSRGAAVLEGLEIPHGFQQFQIIPLVPHQDETQSCISRTPYHPIGRGPRCHRGFKIPVPSPHSTPEKALIPKLEYETLAISEVRGPFERKMHYSYFGPFWKQGIFTLQLLLGDPLKAKQPTYTLQLLLGPIWSRLLCTLQLQRGARGKCLACLPFNTPLHMPDNDLI